MEEDSIKKRHGVTRRLIELQTLRFRDECSEFLSSDVFP